MKHAIQFLSGLILAFAAPLVALAAGADSTSYKIIGYVPSWRGDIQAIQYDKLTHINYAFLEVSPEGSLQALDTARLKAVVEKAHAHGVKVLISVGGGANSAVLGPLIVNPATRKALIPKLLAFMDAHRLDGLDIDWEYPKNASDTAPYEDLMTSLAKALHPKGKLLTTATIGEPWAGDAISAKTLNTNSRSKK